MIVKVTKTVEYEIGIQYQRNYDPDDGQQPGYYAWVGEPGQQSDWCLGPFKTREAAIAGAKKRLGAP